MREIPADAPSRRALWRNRLAVAVILLALPAIIFLTVWLLGLLLPADLSALRAVLGLMLCVVLIWLWGPRAQERLRALNRERRALLHPPATPGDDGL